MKFLIINLERATDRRAFMQTQLEALKVEFAFVPSTDYREMSEADFLAQCDPRAVGGSNYLRGVFAASLSHLSAYKQIVAENLPFGLVCEDDGVFPPNIREILETLTPQLRDDEIVLLSYYHHRDQPLTLTRRGATNVGHGLELLAPTDIQATGSAMAYIVPNAMAKKMIAGLMPVNHAPDHWGKFYEKSVITRLRCLYPHIMKDAPFTAIVEYPATQSWKFKLKSHLRKLPGAGRFVKQAAQQKAAERYRFELVDAKAFWE